ncbi:unnamed protein product [Dibothriocephalus latus]|uniref:Uncharacterized protein n=1 Tax=Dibothriocephalus latus TaxID=60516 RepID=A0A3P7L7B2_DIBLA|nr:unnamed protein product [Dibothriocephalus latus]
MNRSVNCSLPSSTSFRANESPTSLSSSASSSLSTSAVSSVAAALTTSTTAAISNGAQLANENPELGRPPLGSPYFREVIGLPGGSLARQQRRVRSASGANMPLLSFIDRPTKMARTGAEELRNPSADLAFSVHSLTGIDCSPSAENQQHHIKNESGDVVSAASAAVAPFSSSQLAGGEADPNIDSKKSFLNEIALGFGNFLQLYSQHTASALLRNCSKSGTDVACAAAAIASFTLMKATPLSSSCPNTHPPPPPHVILCDLLADLISRASNRGRYFIMAIK